MPDLLVPVREVGRERDAGGQRHWTGVGQAGQSRLVRIQILNLPDGVRAVHWLPNLQVGERDLQSCAFVGLVPWSLRTLVPDRTIHLEQLRDHLLQALVQQTVETFGVVSHQTRVVNACRNVRHDVLFRNISVLNFLNGIVIARRLEVFSRKWINRNFALGIRGFLLFFRWIISNLRGSLHFLQLR